LNIRKVEAKIINTPIHEKFKTSYGEFPNYQSHIFVRITDEDGYTGIGEASQLPFFTGETTTMMKSAIENVLGPKIIGKNIFSLEEIHNEMNMALDPATSAKSAIDMALWDIKGKRLSVPVYQLVGGKEKNISLAYVLGEGIPEEMSELAVQKVEEGFKTLKVKVGLNPDKDIESIKLIRKAIGENINIRIDANQGYTVKTAIQTIERMSEYSIEYVEQPVPGWNVDGLAEVRRQTKVPIMADESVHSIHNALQLIKQGAVDIFGIKLIKCAGITHAMKIINLAEAAGIDFVLISPWDTMLGTHAGGHLSMLSSGRYAHELVGPFYISGDPFKSSLNANGYQPAQQPGFGLPDCFDQIQEE